MRDQQENTERCATSAESGPKMPKAKPVPDGLLRTLPADNEDVTRMKHAEHN